MGIFVSTFLLGEGAFMRFAVSTDGKGFNVHTTGMVLMVIAGIGVVASVGFWETWGGFGDLGRRVVVGDLADGSDHYRERRVNTRGQFLYPNPEGRTASACDGSLVSRVLPNGYCGLSPQQECPHPLACLTCLDFQTTHEFIDLHRAHAEANRTLIAKADASGHFRLAGNLRRVQTSLECIIPSLELTQTAPLLDGTSTTAP